MYTAIVIACAIAGSGYEGCFQLTDNWGPYDSFLECKNRAHTMSTESVKIFKETGFPYEPVAWRCNYDKSGAA